MKKLAWPNLVWIFSMLILLSACNYGMPTEVLPAQTSTQTISTGIAPQATSERKVFLPAIQSKSEATVEPYQAPLDQTFDPHVEIQVNNAKLKVGDTLVLVARPVDIGTPIYSLIVRDEGVQDAPPVANVTSENKVAAMENSSKVLEFISAEGNSDQATFILRAKTAGVTTVSVEASGEVHNPNTGNETTTGGGMGSVLIYITN